MRSEVGKISLDTVFKEREQLNISIVGAYACLSRRKSAYFVYLDALNKASEPWGLICKRYEIRKRSNGISDVEMQEFQAQ